MTDEVSIIICRELCENTPSGNTPQPHSDLLPSGTLLKLWWNIHLGPSKELKDVMHLSWVCTFHRYNLNVITLSIIVRLQIL